MARFTGTDLTCLRGQRLVFQGLEIDIREGEALTLAGPNGSGKSSLLRVLAGLHPPLAGSLAWDGAPIGADPDRHRARLHALGHQDGVKPMLTALESLRFWAALGGAADPAAAAAGGLAALGLADLAAVPGRFLSAGQKRRLALARLAAVPRDLWLLDEPSVGLDPGGVIGLEALIARHRAGGGMVILATHVPISMEGGRVIALDRFAPAPAP